MSSKKNKMDKLLIPAILAGAGILGLGILASKRFIKTQQKNIETNTIKNNGNLLLEYTNQNKLVDKICDDYLNENEKIELNYYKNLLPSEVITELNDLIVNSGASFINLNEYCNKKYNLGSNELYNCINYSKIKSSGCVRKRRDI